jgi:ankyrin repeat protein
MKACAVGSLSLARLCIENGADVNMISKERETALAMAAGASHYVEVDPSDRSTGSSIREYRDDGSYWEWQPYPENQLIELVQALLQAGADPNLPNCENTPLIEAARNGQLQLLQVLLAAGARLDVRDRSGDTAVSRAKLYGRRDILSFLQEYTKTDLSEFEELENEDGDGDDEEQARWGEELPQPDFSEAAQNPDYHQIVNELAELCGGTPIAHDDVPGWFSIHVNSKRRQDIKTEELQQRFLERGCFVYEPGYYYRDGPEKLCILPTPDKYKVIALHQTNGCNYGIGPGYVVQWLRELEAEQPFILTCIAHDTLAGRFLTPIENPEELAERMYDFCSDIVDQGCGSVDILAETLSSNDNLFFWWD